MRCETRLARAAILIPIPIPRGKRGEKSTPSPRFFSTQRPSLVLVFAPQLQPIQEAFGDGEERRVEGVAYAGSSHDSRTPKSPIRRPAPAIMLITHMRRQLQFANSSLTLPLFLTLSLSLSLTNTHNHTYSSEKYRCS